MGDPLALYNYAVVPQGYWALVGLGRTRVFNTHRDLIPYPARRYPVVTRSFAALLPP